MSDYQATWIADSDDESDSEYSGDEVFIFFCLINMELSIYVFIFCLIF